MADRLVSMARRYSRSNRSKYKKRRQQAGFTVTVSLVVIILGGLLFFGVNPATDRRSSGEELVSRTETPTVAEAPEAVASADEGNSDEEGNDSEEPSSEGNDSNDSGENNSSEENDSNDTGEPEIVEAPDVPYNATEKEAREFLEERGFELGKVKREKNDDYDKGGVFFQAPLPGEDVEEGGEVGITLSDGPEPEPDEGDIPDPGTTDLYLTAPKMGLVDDYVVNDASEATLLNGAGKIPETGFPWQESANTYIASHILGYAGTGSQNHFAGLLNMTYGDQATLTDTNGTEYIYEVTEILTVTPYDVWVTEPQAGRDMMTLQTCVNPPAYDMRLVVHFDRVDVNVA